MIPCSCSKPHESKRIVMTGGPGAGKTAVLELIRQSFFHVSRFFVDAASDFLEKGSRALAILRAEMPVCCRNHVVPTLDR